MEVIATIWKQPYYHERNARMIDAGVDALRVKCSHHSAHEISEALTKARNQIDAAPRRVKLLADLPEAKIRLGSFPQERLEVEAGTTWHFRPSESSPDPANFIPIHFEHTAIPLNETFYIGDGELSFQVTDVYEGGIEAKALNSGPLMLRRSVTVPSLMDRLDHMTPFLDEMIPLLPDSRPDMVAFSFVGSGAMLSSLKAKLAPYASSEWRPQIIAKIESRSGVEAIDEILQEADGIMIARGDLALNIPYPEIGVVQKQLIKKARMANKSVIVATGALGSMLHQPIPSRSDITDVTNAYLDGASAIMLCTETAHNERPEIPVAAAKAIIEASKTYDSDR